MIADRISSALLRSVVTVLISAMPHGSAAAENSGHQFRCGCYLLPDYPREKLDIKLVIEEDDDETNRAANTLTGTAPFEIILVPFSLPRTKPKACNYALRFARGEFVVIFDAEDRPEPDQLRKAVSVFRNASPELGCLQASLNFFNAAENWLTSGIMAQTPQAI